MKVQVKNKVWDREAICDLLDNSPEAVARALMIVYSNQTEDERRAGTTKHDNGKGFTGRDAEWLSDVAVKWKRWGRWASERQCNAVRRSIRKYWRQILQHMLDTNPDAVQIKGRQPASISPAPSAPTPAVDQMGNENWGRF